jgi:protein LSM12
MPSLNARTSTTIAALRTADAKRGRGVTREAQDIFDGISRTYPARWQGTAMVVNENVVIEQPYHVEDCRLLGGSAEQGLLRIKKVLAMEREKLALRRGLGTGGLGGVVGRIRGGGGVLGLGLAERKGG